MQMLTRNKHLALAAALLVTTIGLAGAARAEKPASFDEALALAAKQDKVLVVDFFTDW